MAVDGVFVHRIASVAPVPQTLDRAVHMFLRMPLADVSADTGSGPNYPHAAWVVRGGPSTWVDVDDAFFWTCTGV